VVAQFNCGSKVCLRPTPVATVTKMLRVNLLLLLGLYRRYVQLEKAPRPSSAAVGRMLMNERTSQPNDQQTKNTNQQTRRIAISPAGDNKYANEIRC